MKIVFNLKLFAFILVLICAVSCKNDDDMSTDNGDEKYTLGWQGDDDVSQVPTSINFGFNQSANLPSRIDLTPHFPPIGDQGQYGTCVAWSLAYNIKSAIAGMNKGLSQEQLASPTNQYSPKDLYLAIPDHQKGGCNGTNFTFALEVLQSRGVNKMSDIPYEGLGDCSQSNSQAQWAQEAANNRIKYWRRIDPTVTSIKENLSNNIPVILGARLADNFMSWNTDNVISSSTSYNNVGQHAYHALAILGYDDSKGPNGAFRVVNSWSEAWADQGYIWIDYNYLLNEFCVSPDGQKPLFIAADEEGNTQPTNTDPTQSTVDLAPWVFSDYSTYGISGIPNERYIDFNIYNIGSQAASTASNWSFYYLYFNAFDANDYGIITYDNFNTSAPFNSYECPGINNCNFNYEIPAGSNFAYEVFNLESISRTYYMPDITGFYYLVLIADAEDVLNEVDEINNLFYTKNDPTLFQNGYALKTTETIKPFVFENDLTFDQTLLRSNKYNSAITVDHPNAYTTDEVMHFLKHEKKSGNLDILIDRFESTENANPYKTQ